MVKSMTGFGKSTVSYGDKKIIIEVKSLNSKQLDINLRLPNIYREKEMEIRGLIKESLDRGKVDMSVYFDNAENNKEVAINTALVSRYFRQMTELAVSLEAIPAPGELLQTIMRFPETFQVKVEEMNEEEWLQLKTGVEEALQALNKFRSQEGSVLIEDMFHRIENIRQLAIQVPQFESQRIVTIKQRLQEKLKEWSEIKNIDENRLEQELIYYLEKLDITEEKIRLEQHCAYFIETARQEATPGRKLNFIAQEIGREINTMGSKANDHDIQKLVVNMKDELEKIKEQSLNIL